MGPQGPKLSTIRRLKISIAAVKNISYILMLDLDSVYIPLAVKNSQSRLNMNQLVPLNRPMIFCGRLSKVVK